jgi:hypothetical protein
VITRNHIEAAGAVLSRIAFSGGEGAEPSERLTMWRAQEGFAPGQLEEVASESADDTVEELERIMRDSGTLTMEQIKSALEREHLHAFQIGFVVASRRQRAAVDQAVREDDEVVEEAETDLSG